ncbi:hypothetical protein KJA13_03940 [Patescibacteria group bacterium]|nr:hypothetical protein [Patescibacteria group bacterium]
MNKQKILKILNSHDWKEEESQVFFHAEEQFKTCYLEGRNAYKKNLYSACIYCVHNYYGYEWAPKDDAKKALDWSIKKHREDKKYFKRKYKEFTKVCADINNVFLEVKKGLEKRSNKDLKKIFLNLFELGRKQYGYSLLPEGLDTLNEQYYLDLLQGIKTDKALDIVRILSSLEKMSFLEQEKLDLLKLAQKHFKDIKKACEDIEKHRDNYFWIQNSFRGAIYLGNKFFLNSLKELVKFKSLKEIKKETKRLNNKKEITLRQRKNIYKKYKISKQTKNFFELVRFFTLLQDDRKQNIQKQVFCIDQIFNEINKRFKIPKSDLDNYLIKEVVQVLEKGKKVSKKEINRRKKAVIFSYVENNKLKSEYFFGKEGDFIANFFKKKRKELSKKELKGFVASIGKGKDMLIKGKVRIVFDPIKDKFNKGEILLSGMTRPEFVPLMKQAKAIVTNEGGITTHAAIVSRELKKPCIIGTKVATDVIKNGDYIQLNLNEGTIKILK